VPHPLYAVFKHLAAFSDAGVPWVRHIESRHPGPVLGITACTHGNEPAGLAVFARLLTMDVASKLQRGELFLVINNPAAAERFLLARSEEEMRRARYQDVNMNRLPDEVLVRADDKRYEVARAQALAPVWKRFTVGLDIHSTTVPTDPMIISRGGDFDRVRDLIRGFPIDVLISNIDREQLGVPAFALYGPPTEDIPVFAIEAGQHSAEGTYERALTCTLALMRNLGMLEGEAPEVQRTYREYEVAGSVLFPDMSFDLVAEFASYESIHEGQLLARGSHGREIRAPSEGHLLMPTTRRGDEKDISEEIAFITKPMKERIL
jgi:predicted deacylase